MALTSASAAARSCAARSNSITRPTRTLETPSQPRPCSAFSTTLPCTSSTPGLRNTWTVAFTSVDPALNHCRHLLHDAQPPRHLGVALDHCAEVAPEPVFVELL